MSSCHFGRVGWDMAINRHLTLHPSDLAQAPTPWMLPEQGYANANGAGLLQRFKLSMMFWSFILFPLHRSRTGLW